jgi:hypothetical protein
MNTTLEYRGRIQGQNWGKILRLCSMLFAVTSTMADFTPTYGILGLEIFAATVEKGERS